MGAKDNLGKSPGRQGWSSRRTRLNEAKRLRTVQEVAATDVSVSRAGMGERSSAVGPRG